jgi:hypothetical protein
MCVEKQAVTVAEMAKVVGLSRARFYQLLGTAFPFPLYDVATKRPYFTPELQETCLEVRRRNCGIDGKPVLFHQREEAVSPVRPKPSRRKTMPNDSRHRDLVDGLRSLGMAGVTAAEVETALKELKVSDSALKENGKVLRAVFLHLKRQDISPPSPKQKPESGEKP